MFIILKFLIFVHKFSNNGGPLAPGELRRGNNLVRSTGNREPCRSPSPLLRCRHQATSRRSRGRGLATHFGSLPTYSLKHPYRCRLAQSIMNFASKTAAPSNADHIVMHRKSAA